MSARRWAGMVAGLAGLAAAAGAAEYSLPGKWKGTDGQTEGNPKVVDGKPLWRADCLGADDPAGLGGYAPMAWNDQQKRWRGKDGAGTVIPSPDGSNVRLGASMAKTATPKHPGSGALVFIAPAAGKYTIAAKVAAKGWNQPPNQLAEKLAVLKVDKAGKTATELAGVPLAEAEAEVKAEAELAEGDEVVFVQTGIKGGTGSNATLSGLKIGGP